MVCRFVRTGGLLAGERDLVTKKVAAWLLTDSDVDPEREVGKILRVSGSPYEPDSDSTFNYGKRAAKGGVWLHIPGGDVVGEAPPLRQMFHSPTPFHQPGRAWYLNSTLTLNLHIRPYPPGNMGSRPLSLN